MNNNDFGLWVSREIDRRGWSRSEVARRGGISPSAIDKVVNGFARPGPKLCLALAKAFDMSPDDVMRRAGILPSKPIQVVRQRRIVYETNELDHLIESWQRLAPDDRTLLLALIERLLLPLAPRIIGDAPEGNHDHDS